MAVKVRLKDASGEILHPETEWSVIKGLNTGFIVFGYVSSDYDEDTIDYYPAIRAYRRSDVLWTKKFDGTSWTNVNSEESFDDLFSGK